MKYLAVCLVLFMFVVPAGSADNPSMYVSFGIKKVVDDTDYILPNVSGKDRPKIVLFTSYLTDETNEIMQYASIAGSSQFKFYIEYSALYATEVRFHYTWTGPEYKTFTTGWYQANVNTYYWLSVAENASNYVKGTYSLIIVAEQKKAGGGDDCVTTSVFKLY
ncbi:MAG: hypothetical protein MUP70_11630 [Candidatus Aminicenantes bacterium]|nr:hypothetical protein [Candidatus Aminicenantes bacterium]